MEKHKIFLTIREAIRDIIDALVRPDYVAEAAEIFAFLEGGSARTTKGIHPLAENKAPGIIYQPRESDTEEYYHWREFEDLLTRALEDRLPADIAILYIKVFWVRSYEGIDTESNEKGIWVETEMEKFRCKQCGHCCLNLTDAYCNSIVNPIE